MLSAIASTTSYINPSVFRRTNYNFNEKIGTKTGDGFVAKKKPIYPSLPLLPWQTNTALELQSIVYPDGVVKNGSAAQAKINDDQEKMTARVKIDTLQKQARIAPAALRNDLLNQIEEIQHKYFASELNVNELRANQGAIRNIQVNASGHALAAEAQRQGILNELRVLSASGLVRSIPSAPPVPFPPAGSKPIPFPSSSKPIPFPGSGPVPSGSAPSASSTPASSAPSLPTLSPNTTYGPSPPAPPSPPGSSQAKSRVIPKTLTYDDEDTALESISFKAGMLSTKPANTQQLIDLIESETDKSRKDDILNIAINDLDKVKKTPAVVYYLYQLALIKQGLNPNEYVNLKIDGRLKNYDKIGPAVENYKAGKFSKK
jgi:hypothetical protein